MEKEMEKNEKMIVEESDMALTTGADERAVARGGIEWRAKEYVVEKRQTGWYLAVLAIGLGLTAVAVLLKYWSFAVLAVVSVMALFVYVKRPAQEIGYELDEDGLWENGKKLHKYGDFKAFSVVQEGNNFSIVLTPKKRFGLAVRVYFPQDMGEKIVDMFGVKLPMKELKMDFLDKLVKFLRI